MAEIVITAQDQGGTLEADPGDVVVIRLEENMTTGYGWEVGAMDSSLVELLDSEYAEAPGIALGRGGTRTLRFRTRSSGSERIQLRLQRPWESEDAAVEHFEVTIRVR
jgi:inhibitor of cysteine peptidase